MSPLVDPSGFSSNIDERLERVLGEQQRKFFTAGVVDAARLGAKAGSYGSFMPTEVRLPSIFASQAPDGAIGRRAMPEAHVETCTHHLPEGGLISPLSQSLSDLPKEFSARPGIKRGSRQAQNDGQSGQASVAAIYEEKEKVAAKDLNVAARKGQSCLPKNKHIGP